jgi:outer membrane protein
MRSTLTVLAASVLLGVGLAPAAVAQAQKIAVVESQRLLSESPQARAASQALEGEFGPKQKQLEAQKKELDGRLQKFDRDQATMAESERTKTQRDLRDSQVTFERRAKEFQEDVQMRQNEELQRVQKTIFEAVRTYAKEKGYDIVLAGGVIYSADNVDITNTVLENLKAKAAAAAAASGAAATAPAPAAPPKK